MPKLSIPSKFRPDANDVYSIHYSSTDYKGTAVIVTSITILETHNGQSRTFFRSATLSRTAEATEDLLHDAEKALLSDFVVFLREHQNRHWVHWSMRSCTFGWQHLWDRIRTHGITPPGIPFDDLFDLSAFLLDKYGENFAKHPRFYTLIKRNKLDHPDILPGAEEAALARELDLGKVRNSCFRKADRIADILRLEDEGKLKIHRPLSWKIKAMCGVAGAGIIWLLQTVLGGFIQNLFQSLWHH